MSFDVDAVERVIGIRFRDPELLKRAFVDRSAVPTGYVPECNTRLAYLGDGLLRGMLRNVLYGRLELTAIAMQQYESRLLSNQTMNAYVRTQGWTQFIVTGDYEWGGDVAVGRAEKQEATVFEAVIGALHLDAGYSVANAYVERTYFADIDRVMRDDYPRTALQRLHEYLAIHHGRQPVRAKRIINGGQPDRLYSYEYRFGNLSGHGVAATKSAAKEQAAQSLLDQLIVADTAPPKTGGSE